MKNKQNKKKTIKSAPVGCLHRGKRIEAGGGEAMNNSNSALDVTKQAFVNLVGVEDVAFPLRLVDLRLP